MTTRIGYVLAGALVGILFVTPWDGGSNAATGPATIRITNSEISVTRVDIGAKGKSPGDTEIIRQLLFNRRLTQRSIGSADLVCTFVDDRRLRVCRGTYSLPKGKLVVGGSLSYRQFYELAVLGGTGIYDNARGSLVVTRMGVRPVRDLALFRLVG
jgi:hypothetical protein